MTTETKGTFRVEEWHEEVWSETTDGPTLKKAFVKKRYSGDIEGEGVVQFLFTYTNETDADIYGTERFSGRIGDRHGTLVFEHRGEFEKGVVDTLWEIVEKSGTGDLKGIVGEVHFKSEMQEEYSIVLKHHEQKEHTLWKKLTG